jgi:hypothetical protein
MQDSDEGRLENTELFNGKGEANENGGNNTG